MKRIKRIVTLLLNVFVLFLISCGGEKKQEGNSISDAGSRKEWYGGAIRVNETEKYQTLYPHGITDAISVNLAFQIYEGLVKFNPKDLSVVPCIAEKWTVDNSGTVYTFQIKKGVYFHDNICFQDGKGREVKASDFKYCFELLCTDNINNFDFIASFKDRVLGANEYFDESKNGKPAADLEGVKVLDDYTLQVKLVVPDNTFMYILSNPYAAVFPKEAMEMYNNNIKVGTGPFIFDDKNSSQQKVVLAKNNNYHGKDSLGNKLPYLDSILVSFLPEKRQELAAFQEGKIDLIIGLPSQSVKDIVQQNISKFKGDSAEYLLDRVPEMVTQYYEFNLTRPPFNNVKVRQAFNYAIDRDKIIDEILHGEAYGAGVNGISPPAFKEYDITQVKGYSFDADKAKKLLAEAGYPGGKGFPKVKVELNSGGQKNTNVAFEVQKQLSEILGVTIDIDIVPLPQKIEDAKYARSDIFRSGWVADYPSPESFLCLFYGGSVPESTDKPSFPNTVRYKNTEFDKLFEAGKAERNVKDGYANYVKAEQRMMQDAPVIVLWYDGSYRLVKSNVKNFYNNPMRYRYYAEVYKTPAKKTDEVVAK